MIKRNLELIVKGAVIGGTMLIPGVSGGTMAMVVGVYDQLIHAVGDFFQDIRNNFKLLLWFCLGGGVGMLLLAKPLLQLLETFPMPMSYFFLGAVAGSVPMIYRKTTVKSFSFSVPIYVLLGMAAVWLIEFLPTSEASTLSGVGKVLFLMLAGVIAAVALILPGISVSFVMLMMGLYDQMVRAMDGLDFSFLTPLGLGLGLGILSTAKVLAVLMERFPLATYLVILGFMIGSVLSVFPGLPTLVEVVPCLITFALGFTAIYQLSKREDDGLTQ